MPRYFFHIAQPMSEPDTEGHEFPDIYAAQSAAVHLCGELIKEMDGKFWDNPVWQMEVRSGEAKLLFTLTFTAEESEPEAPGTFTAEESDPDGPDQGD